MTATRITRSTTRTCTSTHNTRTMKMKTTRRNKTPSLSPSRSPSSSSSLSLSWTLLATIIITLSSLSSSPSSSSPSSSLFVQASPFLISDERVRRLDITPVLGRGYSIMTDRYHSTCLMVSETTVPSYNYDFTYTNFISDGRGTGDQFANSAVADSFAFSHLKNKFLKRQQDATTRTSEIQQHSVVASMRIERYYSSVREEVSPLSPDALELLDRRDYIGFFKACGPGYVRSIRRAQEVTAIFTYEASSDTVAKEFSEGLRSTSWGDDSDPSNNFYRQPKFESVTQSMEIEIKGYGLGLNIEGTDTLYATSLDEVHDVMRFSFRAMTQAEQAEHIGMVYGMEIVPWVDNPAFQVASRALDDDIFLPLPRSLIPKATRRKSQSTPAPGPAPRTSSPTTSADTELKCKSSLYKVDKFGYCCEAASLYNAATQEYDYEEPDEQSGEVDNSDQLVCRPVRMLDKALVKENMVANGEFVARVDAAAQQKLARLGSTEQCLSATRSIPERFDYHILKAKDTVEYNEEIENTFTVAELKMVLDPLGDYGIISHLGNEFSEFMDMYYRPCLNALFGANIGTSSETEAKYFMAYPWHSHDECNELACLVENMRWDRDNGGCTSSLLAGTAARSYDGLNSYCSLEVDDYDETEVCKFPTAGLKDYYDRAMACWENLPNFSVSYLLDHFCLPDITGDVVEGEKRREVTAAKIACWPETNSESPSNAPSTVDAAASNPGRRMKRTMEY